MDCSTPGFPVLHYLLEFDQTHVHRVSDAIQPSHLLSPSPPAFNLSQHQGLFAWVIIPSVQFSCSIMSDSVHTLSWSNSEILTVTYFLMTWEWNEWWSQKVLYLRPRFKAQAVTDIIRFSIIIPLLSIQKLKIYLGQDPGWIFGGM